MRYKRLRTYFLKKIARSKKFKSYMKYTRTFQRVPTNMEKDFILVNAVSNNVYRLIQKKAFSSVLSRIRYTLLHTYFFDRSIKSYYVGNDLSLFRNKLLAKMYKFRSKCEMSNSIELDFILLYILWEYYSYICINGVK